MFRFEYMSVADELEEEEGNGVHINAEKAGSKIRTAIYAITKKWVNSNEISKAVRGFIDDYARSNPGTTLVTIKPKGIYTARTLDTSLLPDAARVFCNLRRGQLSRIKEEQIDAIAERLA